jgi:hypothetical protein
VNSSFDNTLFHEGRHAYQGNQAAIAGNDEDIDYLVNTIGVFPFDIFQDSTAFRSVCDEDTGRVFFWHYLGPGNPDPWEPLAPGLGGAKHAIEMDAWQFAAAH